MMEGAMTGQVQCLSHSLQCWPPPFPSMWEGWFLCPLAPPAQGRQQRSQPPAASHQPPAAGDKRVSHIVQWCPGCSSIHPVDVHFPLSITGKPPSISGIPISDTCSIWPGIYSLHSSPIVFSKVIIFYWKRYFSIIRAEHSRAQ